MEIPGGSFGEQLRGWRLHRHLSQLALACEAELSARHLSFLETGRSIPSRDMVLRLAERLEVPLRERNTLLLAAGFAPAYPVRSLGDPALSAIRHTVQTVLDAHEPYPALAVDRHWLLVASNRAIEPLIRGAASWLRDAADQRVALEPASGRARKSASSTSPSAARARFASTPPPAEITRRIPN